MSSVTQPTWPIPSGLKGLLPYPRTPWLLGQELLRRIGEQPSRDSYQAIEVLSSDAEFKFILKYFEQQKPPGYGIKRMMCVYNPIQMQSFESGIKTADLEAWKPLFAPKWKEEESTSERVRVIERWKKLTGQFSPLECQGEIKKAKVLPLWHGSSPEKCKSIFSTGFTSFGKHHVYDSNAKKGDSTITDAGYFGSGIYFTSSARYAVMYSRQGYLLLSWVFMREPYPVVSDKPPPVKCSDMEKLEGKEHYQNYNAHFIPVVPIRPNDPECMDFAPCYRDQSPVWDEVVVFEKAQALPRFCLELVADCPRPVDLLPGEEDYQKGLDCLKEPHTEERAGQAFLHFLHAARQRHPYAQYQVGNCFRTGLGSIKNCNWAVQWFREAGAQGHVEAQYVLGTCYARGEGIDQDMQEAAKWYNKAAEQGHAESQFQLGVYEENRTFLIRNIEVALKWYTKAAEQGHARAQLHLGKHFMSRYDGVEKGKQWITKAAEQGLDEAQFELGNYFYERSSWEEAIRWYTRAAEQGFAKAQVCLGKHYASSALFSDQERAVKWYKKGAEQGDGGAQVELGLCYSEGKGVKKNKIEAMDWYKKVADQENYEDQYLLRHAQFLLGKCLLSYNEAHPVNNTIFWLTEAADRGHPEAQFYLGKLERRFDRRKRAVVALDMKEVDYYISYAANQGVAEAQFYLAEKYDFGKGVKEDKKEAVNWYEKAWCRGHVESTFCLARYYSEGTGVDKDEEKATRLFKEAAEKGSVKAQYHLAGRYRDGIGVKKSVYEALMLFQSAARQGHARAQLDLGKCYAAGVLVLDKKQAAEWFKRAADQGDGEAQFELGRCYETGFGVEKNEETSLGWYESAARQGNVHAQYELSRRHKKGLVVEKNEEEALKSLEKEEG